MSIDELPPALGPVGRMAREYSDLNATFHHFDAERFDWLAHYLRQAGRDRIADQAQRWAAEHRQIAATLKRGG